MSSSAPTNCSSVPTPISPLKRRRVVSSFICTGDPLSDSFRVSVFKRSVKVRNYPGKWAACSGSVEDTDPSPLRAALRELHEETGLAAEDLERIGGTSGAIGRARKESATGGGSSGGGLSGSSHGLRSGETGGEEVPQKVELEEGVHFEIVDEKMGVNWEIWPFLWHVVASDRSKSMASGDILKKVKLDWENDELRFVNLEEMEAMDTVDNLARGVREVLASLRHE